MEPFQIRAIRQQISRLVQGARQIQAKNTRGFEIMLDAAAKIRRLMPDEPPLRNPDLLALVNTLSSWIFSSARTAWSMDKTVTADELERLLLAAYRALKEPEPAVFPAAKRPLILTHDQAGFGE